MFRIDHPTAATSLPPPAAAGTPGYFTEGNPATGTPATVVSADWANMVQEEIANVVVGAGLTLSKSNRGQLLSAIQSIAAGGAAGALLKANNLSDLTNVGAARTSLGLGSLATKNAAAISDVTGLQGALDGKAGLYNGVQFATVGIGNGDIVLYQESNGAFMIRYGTAATGYKYLNFGADGQITAYQGGFTASGEIVANGGFRKG